MGQKVEKAEPKKQAAPKKGADPKANPNDPLAQSWSDISKDDSYKAAAVNMGNAKKFVAHSYMSSKADVTSANELLKHGSASFEDYVIKAASKAFTKVFTQDANVASVQDDGVKFIQNANGM